MPVWGRWGAAAGFIGLSFLARYAIFGATPKLPFLLTFPAIFAASLLGRAPGIFAAFVGSACAFYFLPPSGHFTLDDSGSLVALTLYLMVSGFLVLTTDAMVAGYADAEAARQRAEAGEGQRTLMLEEFTHRVKNDMMRIVATLHLQASGQRPEVAMALHRAAERVKVMVRMHQTLSKQDGHLVVDTRAYLQELVTDLRGTLGGTMPIGIFVDAESHHIAAHRASALGLVANEIVTNALKHAFPDDRTGEVQVRFRQIGTSYVLTVTDNGIGLRGEPPAEPVVTVEVIDRRAGRASGMGSRLIRSLAAQLGGSVSCEAPPGGGVTRILRFPLDKPGISS